MTPYREAPPADGLPFPRKNLAPFSAFAIVLAAMVLVLPLPLFATARGWRAFREGGTGMFVLLPISLFVAVAVGLAGAFAVRGHRTAAAIVVAIPVVPAAGGALLGAVAMRSVFVTVGPMVTDGDLRMRLYGMSLGESDNLPAYGLLVASIACGAAAIALLAGGASVDRKHHAAPAGTAWVAPLVFGGLAFVVAIALRLVLRVGFAPLLLIVPSIVMLTAFSCLAARNGPLVRHWHEPRERDAWVASMLAAALVAGGALALLDLAAAFGSEGTGLGVVFGEGIDASQRARILASMADEQHGYRALAVVDGLFGFLVSVSPAFAGLGRGVDGRLRGPRGAPLVAAFAAAALLVACVAGARGWVLGSIEQSARASMPTGAEDELQLPRVPLTARVTSTRGGSPRLRVDAQGRKTVLPAPELSRSNVLVIEADRRASWADVSRAIRESHAPATSIELRVTPLDKADRSQLGPYAALLGSETCAIEIALARPGLFEPDDDGDGIPRLRRGTAAPLRPRGFEIMDAVAASIAMRPTPDGVGPFPDVDLSILPAEGTW